MRINFLLIISLSFLSFDSFSQTAIRYGLDLNFNAPLVKQKQTGFSSNGGLGAGMFLEIPLKSSPFNFSGKLQYNGLSYFSPAYGSNLRSDNYEAFVGIKEYFLALDSSALFFHLVPTFANLSTTTAGQTGGTSQRNRINLSPLLNHRFDLGLNLGMEIQLSERMGLNLSYTQYLNTSAQDSFFDGRPHLLRLGLSYRFGGQDNSGGVKQAMLLSLEKLRADTLYVLNRSCSDRMTDSFLNNLFSINYNYSAYRIIAEQELTLLKSTKGQHFFAIVGKLFGGQSEPESSGIYLLDNNFELTLFPYPVLTTYRDPLNAPCFDNKSLSAQTIFNFNKRLHNKS